MKKDQQVNRSLAARGTTLRAHCVTIFAATSANVARIFPPRVDAYDVINSLMTSLVRAASRPNAVSSAPTARAIV